MLSLDVLYIYLNYQSGRVVDILLHDSQKKYDRNLHDILIMDDESPRLFVIYSALLRRLNHH